MVLTKKCILDSFFHREGGGPNNFGVYQTFNRLKTKKCITEGKIIFSKMSARPGGGGGLFGTGM